VRPESFWLRSFPPGFGTFHRGKNESNKTATGKERDSILWVNWAKKQKGAVKKAAGEQKGSSGKSSGSSGTKGKSSGGSGADKAKRAAREFLK
jgi:hypothetical protein